MFAIINIVIVINSMPERGRGYKTTPASSILFLSQIRMKEDIAWRKAFLHASGLRCSSAFFWSFPSGRRFSDWRQQSFPMINTLGEAPAMWPNKYHWFKRVTSPEEHRLWIVIVGPVTVIFKIQYRIWEKMHWEITFPTTKNILDFLFVLCRI